jgi:hypothetical protein
LKVVRFFLFILFSGSFFLTLRILVIFFTGLYVDHEFPVNASVLPAKVAHRIVSWKRLHELSSNPQLFLDGIEV